MIPIAAWPRRAVPRLGFAGITMLVALGAATSTMTCVLFASLSRS